MRWIVNAIALFVTFATNAQVKDGISVVQYTASFAEQVDFKVKTNIRKGKNTILTNYNFI